MYFTPLHISWNNIDINAIIAEVAKNADLDNFDVCRYYSFDSLLWKFFIKKETRFLTINVSHVSPGETGMYKVA